MPGPPLKRVEELFHQAVALPPERRPTFLGAACGGDADLRAAVETLLRHDADATDVLRAGPVAREAAEARQDAPTMPGPEGDPAAPLPQIPGYELLRELGRGGMGVVYLALHTPLKRLVALKTLPATPTTAEQLDRFRTEAEVLARLQHPNIVPIYDVGEWEGDPYFTMEYVAGPSLADLLDGRPRDVSDAAGLVEDLARAAHAVHQQGIVHRDIKPANVLFQAQGLQPRGLGVPKLTDFGIARDRTSARRLTHAGTILGTPSYMAPEQIRGSRGGVGPGADIYALGSMLYELLTGRPPFDAETSLQTMAQVADDEPLSPSRLRPRLPADVATICLKCLEKSPRRRYATALDLADDLRRFLAREPIHVRPVGPVGRVYRWCLRRPLVAGLSALSAALAVAVVATVLTYEDRLREAAAQKAEAERQDIVQLNLAIALREEENGDAFTAVLYCAEALRRDEEAGASGREDRARIAETLRRCPRLLRMRTHEERVVCTSLTSSGGWIATAGADRVIKVWDVEKGEPRGPGLRLDEVPLGGALSVDGQRLATLGEGGTVRVWDVLSARSRALPLGGTVAVRRLALPAEGRVLLTEHADGAVRLWDLTTDEPNPLPSPWDGPGTFTALSDDARWLVVQDKRLAARVWDMTNGKAAGPSPPLEHAVTAAAVSADGHRLALLGADGSLRVWDGAAAAWLGSPMRPRGDTNRLAFCPDGERVITAGPDPGAQVWRVRTGAAIDLVSRKGATGVHIHVSPDGRFLVARQGPWARVWDLETGQTVTPPLRHGTPVCAASFSADGRQVFTVSQAGAVRVWELPHAAEGNGAPTPGDQGWEGRPWPEIMELARLLACARIDEQQHQEPLDEGALREAWEKLRRAP